MNPFARALFTFLWRRRARAAKGAPEPGAVFPELSLSGPDGRRRSTLDGIGRRWLAVWLTNLCDDCRERIPWLEAMRRDSGGRLEPFAVSLSTNRPEDIARALEAAAFPILLDAEDQVRFRLGIEHPGGACPLFNLYLLDPKGRVRLRAHLSTFSRETFDRAWRSLVLDPEAQVR